MRTTQLFLKMVNAHIIRNRHGTRAFELLIAIVFSFVSVSFLIFSVVLFPSCWCKILTLSPDTMSGGEKETPHNNSSNMENTIENIHTLKITTISMTCVQITPRKWTKRAIFLNLNFSIKLLTQIGYVKK
ncbi:hypothetical protein RND81_14G142500 [Saponaria officinalis]|uniref:Uncharacterized protein n=1 Tax=Saponaria officinalis TaxID=3572 RepID=A0AAW1GM14_SAPOF